MKTKEKISDFIKIYEEIKAEAEDLLEWYYNNIEIVPGYYDIYFSKIENDKIEYTGSSQCGTEYFELDLHLIYLSFDGRVSYAKTYNANKEKRILETTSKIESNKKNRERAEYLRLKKKFDV